TAVMQGCNISCKVEINHGVRAAALRPDVPRCRVIEGGRLESLRDRQRHTIRARTGAGAGRITVISQVERDAEGIRRQAGLPVNVVGAGARIETRLTNDGYRAQ